MYRTKRRFVEGNLEAALCEEPRPGAARKLTGKEEALLGGRPLAPPPARRPRTLDPRVVGRCNGQADGTHGTRQRETVRRRFSGREPPQVSGVGWRCGAFRRSTALYVARMEDVLDLYAEDPSDLKRPVVCFDESSTQPIGEARQRGDLGYAPASRSAMASRVPAQRHGESVRLPRRAPAPGAKSRSPNIGRDATSPNACASLSISIIRKPNRSGSCSITSQPTPPARSTRPSRRRKLRRLMRRLEFHYVPKHARLACRHGRDRDRRVAGRQCLDRRIGARQRLVTEIAAWEDQRNAAGARVRWMFTTERARAKLARAYPDPAKES